MLYMKITENLKIEPLRSMKDTARVLWMYFMEHPNESATTRELAEAFSMNKSTISHAMIALEEAHLMVRTPVNGAKNKTFAYCAVLPK